MSIFLLNQARQIWSNVLWMACLLEKYIFLQIRKLQQDYTCWQQTNILDLVWVKGNLYVCFSFHSVILGKSFTENWWHYHCNFFLTSSDQSSSIMKNKVHTLAFSILSRIVVGIRMSQNENTLVWLTRTAKLAESSLHEKLSLFVK